MKHKLFIHVGAPKCASTSIQNFINLNSAAFSSRGYDIANEQLVFGSSGNNPLWLFEAARDSEQGRELVCSRLSQLRRNGIVSAENLWAPDMCHIFEPEQFEYRILFVVRRQDNWIYSAWQQWYSKEGMSLEETIENALTKHDPDFVRSYEAWSRLAGRQNVKLVSLDALVRPLEEEVLDWLGIEDMNGEFIRAPKHLNVSLDFQISDLLSRHSSATGRHDDLRIENALEKYSELASSHRYRLPDYLAKRIMKRFHKDNVALFGHHIAEKIRTTNDLSRIPVFPRNDDNARDFVIACLLETIGGLSSEVHSLRTAVDHLYIQFMQFQKAADHDPQRST